MDAFIPMLKNVILFVLLAVPGFILVKTKVLKLEHSGVFSKLLPGYSRVSAGALEL